jgi:serine/threonine-protein kinase
MTAGVPSDDALRLSAEVRIDAVCGRFEAAWKAAETGGARPAIEAFLEGQAQPERAALLRELLALELEYRVASGDTPTAEEYHARFPEHAELVRQALARALTDGPRATGPDAGTAPDASLTCPTGPYDLAGASTGSSGAGETTGGGNRPTSSVSGRGRFTRLRHHAQGGLGTVSLAFDETLRREVALKEIRPDRRGDAHLRQRFLAEAEITGQLEHPGVVPVYALEQDAGGEPCYAMRFIQGRSLAEAIRAYHAGPAPLAFHDLLKRFVSVCQTIAYAHSRGVIHRDLKPRNVMVGDYGETLVVDWGLAKRVGGSTAPTPEEEPTAAGSDTGTGSAEALTEAGQAVGTPAYMSPEQAQGEGVGPATDVYALGAILYEILTGQPPYRGEDLRAVLAQVRRGPPAAPSQLRRGLPRALEAVCLKAMARSPAGRYPGAAEVARDVERWLADEPVAAYREPLAARAGRWVKRHRVLVTSAAAALLVALVGLAVVLAVQARSNRELAAANQQLEEAAERERQRFDLAMEAIGSYHKGVSEDVLLKQEQFKELRDRLLGGAASFYRKLGGVLQGQADDRSRRALGEAYYQLAEVTSKVGSKEEALKVHRQGLALRRGLAEAPSSGTAAIADQGRSLIAIGILLDKMGRADEAMASYEEARSLLSGLSALGSERDAIRGLLAESFYWTGQSLAIREKTSEALAAYERAQEIEEELTAAHPDAVDYQRILSWCHNDIGMLLSMTGKPADALTAFEKSGQVKQRIADGHPDVAEYRRDLTVSYLNIGNRLSELGKPGEALAAYERGRTILQQLAETYSAVTAFQSELAKFENNIGAEQSGTGKPAEALAAYGRARDIEQKLADANPAVPEFQQNLARTHHNIGYELSQTGKPAEALAAYERARDIRQTLADANRTVTEFQRDLAASHNGIGWLLYQTGKPAEGLTELEKSRAIRQRLADANPTSTQDQSDLAWSYNNIGNVLGKTGKPAEALAAYERARDIWQTLADVNRTVTEFQRGLAASHNGIGWWVLYQTGKPAEGLTELEKSRAIRQRLADANPTSTQDQSDLAWNYNNIGDVLSKTGKPAEALAAYERARDIRQKLVDANPAVPEFQRELAQFLEKVGIAEQRSGRPAEAVTSYRQAIALLEHLPTLGSVDLYDVACFQALLAGAAVAGSGLTAAEARVAADQAMATLRRAVAAGWRNVAHMRTDSDLDALRQRDDFQKLMKDLEAKSETKDP